MGAMYEQLFKKDNNKKENTLKLFSIALCSIIILITLYFAITSNLIFMLFCILEFYAISWLIKQFYMEYEYSFVNGAVDIDIIYAKSRRKRLASFDCKNVYEVGKYEELKYTSNVIMAANEKAEQLYYFVYDGKSSKQTIVLQPDEKMLSNLKTFISRSVTINKI